MLDLALECVLEALLNLFRVLDPFDFSDSPLRHERIMETVTDEALASVVVGIQDIVHIGRSEVARVVLVVFREELEEIFKAKVFLDLMVRVEKNWSKNSKALRRLGY